MNEYNYLAFDHLAFEQVVDFLSPAERFQMALKTNEEVLNRLAASRSKPRNVSFDVTMVTEQKAIALRFEDSTQNFKILFAEAVDPSVSVTVITSQEKSAIQLLRTLDNVQKIYSGSVSQMTVDLGVLDKEALKGLVKIQYEKLTVAGVTESIPKEEVADVLNTIKATKEYYVMTDIGSKVFPTHPPEKLMIRFATGVTLTDLLKVAGQSAEMELLESDLDDGDINKFIKVWMDSSERTTVSLKVSKKDMKDWDYDQVLQGFQWSVFRRDGPRDCKFVIGRSEAGIPTSVENMSDGRDIVRADGLIASIRITESELFFCVFHKPSEITEVISETIEKLIPVRARLADVTERHEQQHQRVFECFSAILRSHLQITQLTAQPASEERDAELRRLQAEDRRLGDQLAEVYDISKEYGNQINSATDEIDRLDGIVQDLVELMN